MPPSQPSAGTRFLSFPRAPPPNDDVAAVKTNLPEDVVRISQNTLAYHIAHQGGSKVFGNGEAKGLTLIEAYVWPKRSGKGKVAGNGSGQEQRQVDRLQPGDIQGVRPDDLKAVTVCELTVEEGERPLILFDVGMLNVHGTLAGPCATLILDLATFAPLLLLSAVTGVDASGFSTSMNIVWHAPAARGMTLRFVGTSLSLKGRSASARCEVFDARKGTLIISATHLIAPVQGLPFAGTTASRAKNVNGSFPAKL